MICDANRHGRQVNFQAIVVGMPGAGKSTLLRSIARRAILEDGAAVLAHDRIGDWEREWRIPAFRDEHAVWELLAAGKWPRAVSLQMLAADATRIARTLGQRFNTPVKLSVPMFLVYDEGTLVETSGATHQGRDDQELNALRRQWGIGVAYNMQRTATLPDPFWDLTTDVYLATMADERSVRATEVGCGLPRGALSHAMRLPPYHWIHVRRGRGIVAEVP